MNRDSKSKEMVYKSGQLEDVFFILNPKKEQIYRFKIALLKLIK